MSAFLVLLVVSGVNRAQFHTTFDGNVSNVFDSPLPAFFFLEGSSEGSLPRAWGIAPNDVPWDAVVDDSCTDDVFTSPQQTLRDHILPHTLQYWDAAETPTKVKAIRLENADLSLLIAPQWGAKVQSLTHKATGAPLLLDNPTHMPFNGAVRKPFASGGIEWNWGGGRGQIGHSVFSEESAFVAKVEDPEGDHVRIYEYDRFNGTLWQVDLLLPNSSNTAASRGAWIHVKLVNPTDEDLRGYWWTNTARHTTMQGRVLSPARQTAETGVCGSMSCAPFPHYTDECGELSDYGRQCLNRSKGHTYDHSIIGNLGSGRDAFLRVYKGDAAVPEQGNFVAHADRAVYGPKTVGSFHGVTGTSVVKDFGTAPNGTKFFAYTHDRIGQWSQDWESGHLNDTSHKGNYIELQIGPAPTQMQTFSHPSNTSIEWTEYILPMTGADADKLHAEDYRTAITEVQTFLNGDTGMPTAEIDRMHNKLKMMAAQPLASSAIMSPGMPWGALEELRKEIEAKTSSSSSPMQPSLSSRLSPSSPFAFDGWKNVVAVRPWVELLEVGEFSEATLASPMTSYMLEGAWMTLVRKSKPTWLRSLLLGVAEAEHAGGMAQQHPDLTLARDFFSESFKLKANAIAARCLAVSSPTQAQAAVNFSAAWEIAKHLPESAITLQVALAGEVCSFQLARSDDTETAGTELDLFLASLHDAPPQVQTSDNVVLAKISRSLAKKDCASVRSLMQSSRFPTFYTGPRTTLASMWVTCVAIEKEKELKRPLTSVERHNVRVSDQALPPHNIGPFAGIILPH
eukprot:m.236262 g.236262  ORF g.236262 m.236262 type:complete len:794 (-) comp33683_c0_seq2:399-2780(-)